MSCFSAHGLHAGGDSTDPRHCEARYHSQDDVVELRGGGDHGEGDGAGCRGGAEGLGNGESRMEKTDQVFYENITR